MPLIVEPWYSGQASQWGPIKLLKPVRAFDFAFLSLVHQQSPGDIDGDRQTSQVHQPTQEVTFMADGEPDYRQTCYVGKENAQRWQLYADCWRPGENR